MASDAGAGGSTALSPDEAFALLGEETRLAILQALGDAEGPLSFSTLFERVDYDTTANFSYHLERLRGHFVRETEEGYALRQAGNRVVEAVLSGAVTRSPVVERTPVERPCQHCRAPTVEVEYVEEEVGVYCTRCRGQYGGDGADEGSLPSERERIGYLHLPPAGIPGRTPAEMLDAAEVWTTLQAQSLHRGVCPRCSAAVHDELTVCAEHDPDDGICPRCDRRFAVHAHSRCTNCPFELGGAAIGHLHAHAEVLSFLFDHGIDPFSPSSPSVLLVADFEEELIATDPLEVRFTFTIEGDELVLSVDEELEVIEAVERPASEANR